MEPEQVVVLGDEGPRRARHGERLDVVALGLRFMMVNMVVVATRAAVSATMPVPAAASRVVEPNLRRLLSHSPAERLMLRPALLPR